MSPKTKEKRGGMMGFLHQFWRQLWRYFITGMMVWVPLIITIWLCWMAVDKLGGGLDQVFKGAFNGLKKIAGDTALLDFEYVKGTGFGSAVALFLITGFLTRYLVGRRIIHYGEAILERIPFISKLYRAVQQIRDVFVSRNGTVFQKVCLVEYPRPGMIAMAFITATEKGIVQDVTEKELFAVFIPTTPNPTSGYLVYLPPDQITELDIGVEEAMKLIISGGAYQPSLKSADAAKDSSPL